MELSILIVNWNTRELLLKCLESIEAFPPPCRYELIVVDNGSTDDSVQMVRQQFPDIVLIENPTNVGFGAANNQAIVKARGRYTLLLNSDTEVKTGAFESLFDYLVSHPNVGVVGPRLLNSDGTVQLSAYPEPTLFREIWRLFKLNWLWSHSDYQMEKWDTNVPRAVDALKGACMLLRREVLAEVGFFDEDFFFYGEEIDLCHRIRKAGWELFWVPQAEVVHHGGQSSQNLALETFVSLYRGKITYFRKHYGSSVTLSYKGMLLAAAALRFLLSPLACLIRPSRQDHYRTLASRYRHLLTALWHV